MGVGNTFSTAEVEDQREGHFQRLAVKYRKDLELTINELNRVKAIDREYLEAICLLENRELKEKIQQLQQEITILQNKELEVKKYYATLS